MLSLEIMRKQKKLTMVDLASQIGISQSYYSSLEQGKKPVSVELIEKIANAIGEPVGVVAEAARSTFVDERKLRSWIGNIRINGLPFPKAFEYYLEAQGNKENVLADDELLKKEIRDYVERNIGYAVIAEMTENRNLLPTLRMRIAEDREKKTNTQKHEQFEGIQ